MIPQEFFTHVTARARVAFATTVAERNLHRIVHNPPGHALTEASLGRAWDWVEGLPVAPKLFSDALLNENDKGLLIFEYQASEAEKTLWLMIESAVAYAGWHVYSAANASMPDMINETGEKGIHWLVDYALEVSDSNQKLMELLAAHCRARHRTNDAKELGTPISRAEFTRVASSG